MNATAETMTAAHAAAAPARITAVPAADWDAAASDWRGLTARTPHQSVFAGAEWIGAWIRNYQQRLPIKIIRIYDGAELIGACLLTRRIQWKGPVPLRNVYLNAAGEDQREEVGAEFNHFVCLEGREAMAAAALRRHLDATGWDNFILPGCAQTPALQALKDAFQDQVIECNTEPSYYVDLRAIRDSGKSIEMSISKNSRQNIRESVRLYQEFGPLRLDVAGSAGQAHQMLSELAALHADRWAARGLPGAFASPRFRQFHQDLIDQYFDQGLIHLMRVSAGDHVIGVIYNLVAESKVFFYQCGFRITPNHRLRPGLVTLLHALEWYRKSRWSEFDLMAGDMQYKRSFGHEFRKLEWCRIGRRGWRTSFVFLARQSRRRCREMFGSVASSIASLRPGR